MNKDLLYVILANSVSVICFTILAIVFNHWWISLFSLLFMVSYKYREEQK